MKEYPILFNGEMVRAIMDGIKTVTRRLIKRGVVGRMMLGNQKLWPHEYDGKEADCSSKPVSCPCGVPGDRLWVRETWGDLTADHPRCKDGQKPKQGDRIVYRANPADDYQWGSGKPSQGDFCWRPSIYMPRWASRLTLEVVSVRVERMQEIDEMDATHEGIEKHIGIHARHDFSILWDSINAKRGYGWDANPWVWVIEFKQLTAAGRERENGEGR